MHQKLSRYKRLCILFVVIQALMIGLTWFMTEQFSITAAMILVLEAAALYLLFDRFESLTDEQSTGVRSVLGSAASQAYLTGEVGMVIYNEEYVITWMSELFNLRGIDRNGKKLLSWLPEADDLISGKADSTQVILDEHVYHITRKEDAPVLFFRDITELNEYRRKYHDEHIVLGYANFDNYDESIQFEDEADAANISANVRVPLMEYCSSHGIVAKRLNTSKYLLVLNEKILQDLIRDRFSILNKVRKASTKMDVSITLSLAFAKGNSDLEELDEMAAASMELAQTRGGDQVAVQSGQEDVKFYGGSSEAAEKRSRVRVRVMSHALRDLIQKSSNVIVVGHKVADFDCIGSAICLSEMVTAMNKPCAIIAKTGGIEEKLMAAMEANEEELAKTLNFVTEGEALNQLGDKTLVIMTDHHSLKQSNGARVLEIAKKIVVIDHHRRSTDMGVKPILIYIEAGASSTCELLTEMLPYVSAKTDLSELEATFMLTGMIVDTQKWKVRTGTRTYDAASVLREIGADPAKAYGFLQDTYDDLTIKAMMIAQAQRIDHDIIITTTKDKNVTRSLMSQVADTLLNAQGVQASFVIAKMGDSDVAISARSAGKINVQMIMEKMGGGGHRSAAALQRSRTNNEELLNELKETIQVYFEEEDHDESDS